MDKLIICPYCDCIDGVNGTIIKNLFNTDGKGQTVYADYSCMECDSDFMTEGIKEQEDADEQD